MAFVTKMSEKRKSKSSCAVQVENGQKAGSIEETYDVKTSLKKLNELFTYVIMLDALMLGYVQFVIMLT